MAPQCKALPTFSDRRYTGAFPPTIFETGCWECFVDRTWVLYAWPTCSILEQGFCQYKDSVEFKMRGENYRMEFEGPLECEGHSATQVNVRTSVRRRVRRWPSLMHRSQAAQRQQKAEEFAWVAWLQSDFTWTLLDPQEFADGSGCAQKFPKASPECKRYSLGPGISFAESWWPLLLRTWTTESLTAADHPFGNRCSFALRSLPTSSSFEASKEWELLCQTWQAAGLANRSQLVGAYRIQNRGLIRRFVGLREAMFARLSCDDFEDGIGREQQLSAKLLWHGTRSVSDLLSICSDGFDRTHATTCRFGRGCYFATTALYSNTYACSVKVPGAHKRNLKAVLLACVLVGEKVQGSNDMYPPPVKPHSRYGERYENTCDNVDKPGMYVTYTDGQALPIYVLVYEVKS